MRRPPLELAFVLPALVALAACGPATPAAHTDVTRSQAAAQAVSPTSAVAPATAGVAAAVVPGEQPAATLAATALPGVAAPDAPRVVAQGFSTKADGGSYAVVVENPGGSVLGVHGAVRFASAGGDVALKRSFAIPYIAPHGRSGWADTLPASPASVAVKMEVSLLPVPPGPAGSDAIAIEVAGGTGAAPPLATLLLTNHNAEQADGVRLSVVAYRADGTIAGGTSKSAPELPPHLDTQVVVPLPGIDSLARIEAYAAFTPATRTGDSATR